MTIRPAVEEDRDQVLALWNAFDNELHARHPEVFRKGLSRLQAERRMKRYWNKPRHTILVLDDAGLQGFLLARAQQIRLPVLRKPRLRATLLVIYVQPAERDRGLGGHLLDNFVAWAKETGADEADLHLWEPGASNHLYQRAGFQPVSTRWSRTP